MSRPTLPEGKKRVKLSVTIKPKNLAKIQSVSKKKILTQSELADKMIEAYKP